MSNIENIKTFAIKILGCNCPEHVFNNVVCQSKIRIDNVVLHTKINIGNRLLIYIIEPANMEEIRKSLPIIFKKGKNERDSLGFNRFRLVIATEKTNELEKTIDEIWNGLDRDEKTHLHIVSLESIQGVSPENSTP